MAVFAPIDRLGLVWVEGEDDASLKEEQVPRYHAREVARQRASIDRALLVLASTHSSLESWWAVQQGQMTSCVYRDPAKSPNVQVIDLKAYSRDSSTGSLLSPPLCEGIRDALRQNALAIVYLNRKGFASVLHCGDCGAMPQCDACSVALTFFRRSNQLRCHYCGRGKSVPDHCRQCQSLKLEPVGSGTERIEEAVRRRFPQARVARVDGETIRRPADARAFRRLLGAGELDIVIGTQMLFRLGLQAQAAFVAVPDADAGLHVPDFRSAERMYHGLLDAVELARPAHAGGLVIVQTRFTDHHAMVALAEGNDSWFFEREQAFRQMLQYPPFTHLVRLDVSGTLESAVAQAADRWGALLRTEVAREERQNSKEGRGSILPHKEAGAAGEPNTLILGPSPAPHALARGRYCWQILVKSVSREASREMVVRTRELLERESRRGGLRFDIDVDPVAMA
jgi:primosomal protein N' (replication factor Y)